MIFVAEEENTLVGFVQLFQTYNTVRLTPALILEDLFVDCGARGRGIATSLLREAEGHARSIGTRVMFLETAMTNTAAQAVYERAGWTKEAEFYKYNAPL